jgi:hypothetical protein
VDVPEISGLPEITRGWPAPRRALIAYLKRCKRFFSFDRYTALNGEAQLCGCEVFVWNEEERVFDSFFDPQAEELVPNLDRQLSRVQEFLAEVACHFGVPL